MDELPFVTPVYKRDLTIENYFIGYLKHPYISLYTGRGCKSRCTFCLWPQTVGGHRYRTRSVGHVIDESRWAQEGISAGEGILLRRRHLHRRSAARRGDRARDLASSASSGHATPRPTCRARRSKVMRDNGLRLLLVGYESGNQQILHNIKKGMLVDVARRFTRGLPRARHHHSRHLHPGAARRDAEKRSTRPFGSPPRSTRTPFRFRSRRPIPGPILYRRRSNMAGSTKTTHELVDDERCADRAAALSASEPHRDFPFRRGLLPALLFPCSARSRRLSAEMVRSPEMMKRRLREGVEFFEFLRGRRELAN